MKKTHIVLIAVIAVAIGSMVAMLGNATTYSSFTEAATTHKGSEVHVIGKLNKEKPFEYNPQQNANRFGFYMIDQKQVERKVILLDAKPTDFERSEQIVAIGHMEGDAFVAKSLQLKCPSKYSDEKKATAGN